MDNQQNKNTVEINTNENLKNQTEYTIMYQESNGATIPVINGKEYPQLCFGYVSESDKKACEKLLKEALQATNGDVYKTMEYIRRAMLTTANNITPNKQVEVEGVQLMISYQDRKAYTLDNQEVANLDNLNCELPDEAIETLLIERANESIKERNKELERLYCSCCNDEDYDYDDGNENDDDHCNEYLAELARAIVEDMYTE